MRDRDTAAKSATLPPREPPFALVMQLSQDVQQLGHLARSLAVEGAGKFSEGNNFPLLSSLGMNNVQPDIKNERQASTEID